MRAGFGLDISPVSDAGNDGADAGHAGDGSTIPPVVCGDWTPGRFTFDHLGIVTELSVAGKNQQQPQLSYDGLRISFARDQDLFEATRNVPTGPFGAPTPIPGLATPAAELGAFVVEDRLTAYVMVSDPQTTAKVDLLLYARTSTSDPFEVVRALSELNTEEKDWDPFLAYGGQRIYGARVVDSSYYPIWSARAIAGTDGFGTPQILTELDTLPLKGNPSLTYDQKIIVFNGAQADREYRLYYATRSDPTAAFSAPARVPGLEAVGRVGEPFVTPDGCELYFNKSTAVGAADIHRARYRAL